MAKSWQEKFFTRKQIEVKLLEKDFADLKKGTRMLISTPSEIADYIQSIPKHETRNVLQMRKELAIKHGADGTCPLTTGIFLRIVAEVSLGQISQGVSANQVVPFWRVVDPGSALAKKLSCGAQGVAQLRAGG